MSKFTELAKRHKLLKKMLDSNFLTLREEIMMLMEMIMDIIKEMQSYSYDCAKCGSLKLEQVIHSSQTSSYGVVKCSCCHGDVIKNII